MFWPVEGYTKGDLLAYYESVWPWLAPYLRDRPLVLTRYPDGIEGKSFYQKNAPEFTPDWVHARGDRRHGLLRVQRAAHVAARRELGRDSRCTCGARGSRSLERPDWLILDLDPKQAPFSAVVRIARHLHALFDALEVRSLREDLGPGRSPRPAAARRGVHARRVARAGGGDRAHGVCGASRARHGHAPVAGRGDKVYVDFLQNGRGKLIAAPLCVRPRPGAPVSMPLTWREVTPRLAPGALHHPDGASRGSSVAAIRCASVLGPGIDAVRLLDGLARRLDAAGSRRRRA